ncbi:hypothetical protein [Novosphingobium sp. PhB165]|uniref:hypothetical protein n=1 Tax=Novosphingobium sp. PhB165 TaxID=2485105 RepID=UPI001051C36D|nr:hypothetical protein [Novosphingobium sp. PhB165]
MRLEVSGMRNPINDISRTGRWCNSLRKDRQPQRALRLASNILETLWHMRNILAQTRDKWRNAVSDDKLRTVILPQRRKIQTPCRRQFIAPNCANAVIYCGAAKQTCRSAMHVANFVAATTSMAANRGTR